MSDEIYKPLDFYEMGEADLTVMKDGHTMTVVDVLNDLNNYRRGFLTLQAEVDNPPVLAEGDWDLAQKLADSETEAARSKRHIAYLQRTIEELGFPVPTFVEVPE